LIRPSRSFEDLELGERRTSTQRTVAQVEIIDFACQYDPQWFHSDVEAAKDSHFGEVVASGIHVLALWRQMDHEMNSDIDFVCGIGFDKLRLKSALRGGDTVYVTSEITDLAPSKSGKDRGTAVTRYAMIKQTGEVVVTFDSINLVYTRVARTIS
jgi:acyl dehydratase